MLYPMTYQQIQIMFDHSPKKRINKHTQSMGFICSDSPNRFRQTFTPSSMFEIPSMSYLRQSVSMQSLDFFDQFQKTNQNFKQNKQQTFQKLKTTLNELQSRIKKVNQNLIRRNFNKKKTQKLTSLTLCRQVSQQENEQNQDKNRETISTALSHECCVPIQKISQFITSQPKPQHYHPFTFNPYDSRSQNFYYLTEAIRAANQKNSLVVQHINMSIKMIQSCSEFIDQGLLPNTFRGFQMKRLQRDQHKKKTLVLDLDETLIHCYENEQIQTDIKLSMTIDDTKATIGVNIRPYVMTFLKRMAQKFEIVIFTASHKTYADAILDELDPDGVIFSHRFYRDHCTVLPNELHVKDLRHLNRDLKNVVLVDNAAYSYAFQLENGIPVLPFYEGKDFQLAVLERYLEKLSECEDVREFNKNYFRLQEYSKFQSAQQLIKQLYKKMD